MVPPQVETYVVVLPLHLTSPPSDPMATLVDPPALETGKITPAPSCETTALLSNEGGSIQYGTNGSGELGSVSRVRSKSREETDSDEEEPLLSKSAMKTPSGLTSLLDASLISPLNRTCRSLTGGWSDEVSLRLQNSGSVARDHLALERTFLAYMRTSLAIASAGVALVQLFNTSNKTDTERIEKYARPLGASVIAMGLIVLAVGLIRYFIVQSALVKGIFPVARLTPVLIATSLTSLVTVVFSLLVSGRLEF